MKHVQDIQRKLQKIDKKLYIVGGFCRDKVLDKKHNGDIDIVTDALPSEMLSVLKVVGEVGKKYGTCIVSQGGEAFELTTFRKDIGSINYRKPAEVEFTDSLIEDSKRRDFTCNAIYFDPQTQEFLDPQNGIDDMQKGIIRFVGDIAERIHEDSLRILRCIRFKNKYNFRFADENYMQIIKDKLHLLKNLPVERIRQELDAMLLDESNVAALEDLKQLGFLDMFLPELACLDQYPGNKYHLEGDVWIHTKMCIGEMNIIIRREGISNTEKKITLLWAILLHDIGKAPTFSVGEDGESHYYNHEHVGADMFRDGLSNRLKFSNESHKIIYFVIEQHLRLFHIPNMRKLKARKLMMHPYFQELLYIGEADNKGRRPVKHEAFNEIMRIYREFQELLPQKEFLTGNDIMQKYPDLKGPEIGERLQMLNDQILVRDK